MKILKRNGKIVLTKNMEIGQRDSTPSFEDWTEDNKNKIWIRICHMHHDSTEISQRKIYMLDSLVNIQPCILKKVLIIKVSQELSAKTILSKIFDRM